MKLQGSTIIVAVNKITDSLMPMNTAPCRYDIGDAKRSVRNNNYINANEAWYLTLVKANVLEKFKHYLMMNSVHSDLTSCHPESFKRKVEHCNSQIKYRTHLIETTDDVVAKATHVKSIQYIKALRGALDILEPYVEDAYNLHLTYGDKNIHWDKVTSVQFMELNAETLTFEPISHVTVKVKKGK
ncbi:hypothetical protein [Yersinia phage vB_YenM_P778]